MRKDKIIYSINIEDIQNVATEVFGRELHDDEIKKIIDPLGDRIGWYDAIADAIGYTLGLQPSNEEKNYEADEQ